MNGNLAQQICLISFGNEYLKTEKLPDHFFPDNPVFQFCNAVRFIDFKKFIQLKKFIFSTKKKQVMAAKNPYQWFEYLKGEGCEKIELHYEHSNIQSVAKDYKLAGFVGGRGAWLIEAVYDNYSDYWASRWTVTDKEAPDKKIWTVEYGAVVKKAITKNLEYELIEIKTDLNNTLIKIRDFSKQHNLDYWTNTFDKALNALNNSQPYLDYYYKDLINLKTHSLIAQQILFASAWAFVFGGMGSWNDLGFTTDSDNQFYEDISSELYDMVNKGIVAALNA